MGNQILIHEYQNEDAQQTKGIKNNVSRVTPLVLSIQKLNHICLLYKLSQALSQSTSKNSDYRTVRLKKRSCCYINIILPCSFWSRLLSELKSACFKTIYFEKLAEGFKCHVSERKMVLFLMSQALDVKLSFIQEKLWPTENFKYTMSMSEHHYFELSYVSLAE